MRLTCHMGLVCPEGAKVRVGETWGTWQAGSIKDENDRTFAGNGMIGYDFDGSL